MDAHRVEVFDRADDDAVVLVVAHDLHLELFPADHRFFDQQFMGRRRIQSALADGDELFLVVGDAAAGAAQRERGPDDGRIPDHGLHLQRLFQAVRDGRTRAGQPDPGHRLLEFLAVLGLVDGFPGRADQFHVVLFQHAMLGEVQRAVQRGLPAHRRQQRIGPLDGDDLLDHLPVNRLDVGDVRHFPDRS